MAEHRPPPALTRCPAWVADAVFYAIIPDRATPPTTAEAARFDVLEPWSDPPAHRAYKGGTLDGIISHLDRLVDLGVTALYLTPHYVGPTYHRYKPQDLFRTDPLLGGDEAFDRLVAAAKQRGLRMIVDGVFHHVSIGHRAFVDVLEYGPTSAFRDWFHIHRFPVDPSRRDDPGYRCWNHNPSMPVLNHRHPAVREHLIAAAVHWTRRGVDGWRLDAPEGIEDPKLWPALRAAVRAIDPDVYLVGEIWTDPSPWLGPEHWDGAVHYPLLYTIREWIGGEQLALDHGPNASIPSPPIDAKTFAQRLEGLHGRHFIWQQLRMLTAVSTHDIARLGHAFGDDGRAIELANVLLFTLPGAPCVYYGDEVGMTGGLPPDNRRGFPADPSQWRDDLLQLHRDLIGLRRRSPALRRGRLRIMEAGHQHVVYARELGGEQVVVMINNGVDEATVQWPKRDRSGSRVVFGAPELVQDGAKWTVRLAGRSCAIVRSTGDRRRRVQGMSERDLDSVVIGNIGIDTNVYLPPGFSSAGAESAFTDNEDTIGQAGGFSTFGYARLGLKAGFIGYVGLDPLGRYIEAELDKAGVTTALFVDPAGTSRSINLMRPDGTRRNFYDGKAHMTLAPDLAACRALIDRARLLHVHLPNWARQLLPYARERGVPIACDLQDIENVDDPYRHDFIEAADYLFCSATNFDDPREIADALLRRNPKATVVLGLGRNGAMLADRDGHARFAPENDPRPVVDTNGAGDSLAVGFLTARVIEGRPAEEAIRWGQIAARHACTLRSSLDLITRPELIQRAQTR